MRRLSIIIAVWLLACAVQAGWNEHMVTCAGGTNAAVSVTQDVAVVKGELVGVHVVMSTATDVDVDVTAVSPLAAMDAFSIYSADDVTADTRLYPVFDSHGADGVALTNDPPRSYPVLGETVRVVISDWAATGKVVIVKIIWKDN